MRGRTALYGPRHLAQVIAIKRLQSLGRSLAEIQAMWPTLDDATLAQMSGVALVAGAGRNESRSPSRHEFWKRDPIARSANSAASALSESSDKPPGIAVPIQSAARPTYFAPGISRDPSTASSPGLVHAPAMRVATTPSTAIELRIELAPNLTVSLSVFDGVDVSPDDVRAIRAAAAPMVAELVRRGLHTRSQGDS
jgi:hypothetical protein